MAWAAGLERRISDAKKFPGHRSPPASEDAVQTPLGREGGMAAKINALERAGISFSAGFFVLCRRRHSGDKLPRLSFASS
jgi:hypothetical protein